MIGFAAANKGIASSKGTDKTIGEYGQGVSYRSKQTGIFAGGWWLRCAHPNCGCQVIYDPKQGISRMHHYYHCANGKKIHKSMAGMNAREENIWAQFAELVGVITITESLAEQIAEALNETHLKAKAAKKKRN